ncbi:hypothetical protein K443DRAFT_14346 [Laccaria amethystina LaAM-08-1]|uniref:Uncharacterized protein n=1 Tax=Laccaria amethystina LaAM-08-1 TaxID=1095629 RepID=A0A0C9WMZ7_9AGAR|nr:hypothetical protein K443DRAFT_14346 [Laccaria amethystina LaAM-08-1]
MVPDSTFLNYITSEKLAFKSDRDRPNDPMRTYATFYTLCFLPATKSYVINSRDEPMEFDYAPSNWGDISEGCRNRRVRLRTTALVASGLCRGMSMTCWNWPSGVDTDVDVQRGAKLIRRVYEGPFLPEKKGVAASLVCYLFVNCDDPHAESRRGTSGAFRNWVAALHFAAQSCRLGHFSFACNFVAETSLTIGAEFQPTYDQELREELDLVLAHRQAFQEETGYQPRKPQIYPPIHKPFSHSPQSLPLKRPSPIQLHHLVSLVDHRESLLPADTLLAPEKVFTPQDAQSSLNRRHKTKRFDFSLPHLRRSTNLPFLTDINSSSILRPAHEPSLHTTLKAASTPSAGLGRTDPTRSSPPVSLSVFRRFNASRESVVEPNLEPTVDSSGPRPLGARTTPPPTPPHTRTSPTTVFYGPACSSTTPSHLAQQTSSIAQIDIVSQRTRRKLRLSKKRRFALPAYNLQSGVECNGEEFNVVLYPFVRFELLVFQMQMQAETSNHRHHRGSEANSLRLRQFEGKPGGRMMYRGHSAFNPCSSSFLPIEKDSS